MIREKYPVGIHPIIPETGLPTKVSVPQVDIHGDVVSPARYRTLEEERELLNENVFGLLIGRLLSSIRAKSTDQQS